MQLSIKNDLDRMMKDLTAIEKRVLPRATLKTLNRVGNTARSKVVKGVAKESGAKQKDIRRRFLFSVRASMRSMSYLVRIRYGSIPLKDFSPKQTKNGVSAKAWGKTKVYDGAFKVDQLGGHVFVRQTKARFPLKKLYGPIPSRIASNDVLEAQVVGDIRERLPREMKANIKFYADRFISRGR